MFCGRAFPHTFIASQKIAFFQSAICPVLRPRHPAHLDPQLQMHVSCFILVRFPSDLRGSPWYAVLNATAVTCMHGRVLLCPMLRHVFSVSVCYTHALGELCMQNSIAAVRKRQRKSTQLGSHHHYMRPVIRIYHFPVYIYNQKSQSHIIPAHPSISQHQHTHKMQVQMQRTTH
jgi:hypothetical protein